MFCGFGDSTFDREVRERVTSLIPRTLFVDGVWRRKPREFPDFIIADSKGMAYEVSPFMNQTKPQPKGCETIELTSADLRSIWSSLDRVYLKSLPMLERERIWDGWITGWAATIKDIAPGPVIAVFRSTPHFHWDFALSLVLQDLGARVLSLSPSATDGLLLAGKLSGTQIADFAGFTEPASLLGTHSGNEEISSRLRHSRALHSNLREIHRKRRTEKNPLKRIFRRLRKARLLFRQAIAEPDYWPHGPATRLVLAIKWLRRKDKVLRLFDEIGIRSAPVGNFAYFALHFQPERSTTPEAGDFWGQIGAIRKLRSALPDSFELVVGEHPRQILPTVPDLRQELFRSLDYYRQISEIPGVTLAHWSLEGSDLIKGSQLVASCTGSSPWEAIQLGIPGVVFGNTFYSSCESCLIATDGNDFEDRVRKLLEKKPNDVLRDAESVFTFTAKNGVPGFNTVQLRTKINDSNISAISAAMAARLVEV